MRRLGCCSLLLLVLMAALGVGLSALPKVLEGIALETATSGQMMVELSVGETHRLPELVVRLVGIGEDTRCSLAVRCAQRGSVTVELAVNGVQETVALGNVLSLPNGYAVQVMAVEPYPESNTQDVFVRLMILYPIEGGTL